jgi:hypothetical protein
VIRSFSVAGLGSGRIAIYENCTATAHRGMLAWASHGVERSRNSVRSVRSRTFGFVIEAGEQLLRPGADAKAYDLLIDRLASERQAPPFHLESAVPDLLVFPHGRDFGSADYETLAGVTPRCDLAVLLDFAWASPCDARYSEMKDFGYPPLGEIIDGVECLAQYDTWLMLCCRTSISMMRQHGRGSRHAGPRGPFPFAAREKVAEPASRSFLDVKRLEPPAAGEFMVPAWGWRAGQTNHAPGPVRDAALRNEVTHGQRVKINGAWYWLERQSGDRVLVWPVLPGG